MVNKKQLEEVYKQNLENDIINTISKMKGIDLREAFDIYYSSKLAEQISNDSYGIENMDAKYLAEDLIENESNLFEQQCNRMYIFESFCITVQKLFNFKYLLYCNVIKR